MNVGERMKNIRKKKGINADQLAAKIGVSRSTIFRYEKGDIEKVPVDVVSKVADALNVDLTYLMGLKPDEITGEINKVVTSLHHDRQKKVLAYAQEQLTDQISIMDGPETLAAHQADPNHKINDQEAKEIGDYLDGEIDKYNSDK